MRFALCLADETKVRVVHQYVQVRNLELRPDSQLLDHELEVVVAGKRDHLPRRVGHVHAESSRQRPSERPRLSAIDPVPRLLYAQKLRHRDLRQSDRADVTNIVAKHFVHLVRRRAAA